MLSTVKNAFGQSFGIPTPPLTEKNLASQAGRVHIVTGGYAGVGQELSRILYAANAVVYIAGRSQEKADKAIKTIKQAVPDSKGRLEFLKLDLADLPSIKPAVDAFVAKENRLDVLTNNAGVMIPPSGSKTAQDHELQIGTNVLGPYLLTSLLRPLLTKTASSSPPGSVRVTWAGSLAVDIMSPKPGGISFAAEGAGPKVLGRNADYGQSKAGNLLLANESAKKWGTESGVLHLAWNPGNLKTELQRHASGAFLMNMMLYPATYGAYTELYAGCSEELGMTDAGKFIVPWGRVGSYRQDIAQGITGKSEGGLGTAERLYEWCEKETKTYA